MRLLRSSDRISRWKSSASTCFSYQIGICPYAFQLHPGRSFQSARGESISLDCTFFLSHKFHYNHLYEETRRGERKCQNRILPYLVEPLRWKKKKKNFIILSFFFFPPLWLRSIDASVRNWTGRKRALVRTTEWLAFLDPFHCLSTSHTFPNR